MTEQDFNNWLASKGFKGDFGLRPGETKQAWAARIGGLTGSVQGNVKALFADPDFAKNMGATGAPQGPGQPSPGGQPDYTRQIQDFYRMMTDPNAPELKAAGAQGVNAGQRAFGSAGIRGGLSDAGIAKAGMDSRNGMFMQRSSLGLQALQTGSNRDLNLGTDALARDRFAREGLNDQYNKDQAMQQGLVSAGGQVIKTLADLKGTTPSGGLQGYGGGATPYDSSGEGYGTSQPSDWSNPYGGY